MAVRLEAGLDKHHNWQALELLEAEETLGWFAACYCQHWAFATIDQPNWLDLARRLLAAAAAAASEVEDSHYMGLGLGLGLGLHKAAVDSSGVVVDRQAVEQQILLCGGPVELPQVDPIPGTDQTEHCYQQIGQIPAARSLPYAEHACQAPPHHAHLPKPAAE